MVDTPMTSIVHFFRHKVVFITGVTGFLGKPLLVKILKDLPDIRRIYLLIRPKELVSGEKLSAATRFATEILTSDVFTPLRELYGESFEAFIQSKVVPLDGDITHPELGLSPEQYTELLGEVDVIINSAAVVMFDAPLDEAVQQNTLAPQHLVKFAQSCVNAVYLHVSTAYVHGQHGGIVSESLHSAFEMFGQEHPDPNGALIPSDLKGEIQDLLDRCRRIELNSRHPDMLKRFRREALRQTRRRQEHQVKAQIETLRKRWVRQQLVEEGMRRAKARGWKDTYTFTKALGEQMIAATRGDLPVVILRPSIIESSLAEPYPGWLDGFRMADPLIIAFGKGRLKDFPLNPDAVIDLIPVDFVVNAILAAIPRAYQSNALTVYQVATGTQNPLTNRDIYELSYDYFCQNPMLDKQGKPIKVARWSFPSPRRFYWTQQLKYRLPLAFLRYVSEYFLPFRWATSWKHRLATLATSLDRLFYYAEIYGPYITVDRRFETTNTQGLFASLSPQEQQQFNFDVTTIDWKHYIQDIHIPGIKRHILKLDSHSAGPLMAEVEMQETQQPLALPPSTLSELFERTVANFPEKTALQIKRDGGWIRYSYQEIQELIQRMKEKFLQYDYRKGDRVLLYAENQPEWGIAYLAAVSSGLTVVPVDWQTPEDEVWSLARFTQARSILVSEFCFTRFSSTTLDQNKQSEFSLDLLNINRECAPFYTEEKEKRSKHEERNEEVAPTPESIASVIFTTGTAVDPKGVMLSHKNFLATIQAAAAVFDPQPSDQFLSVLPLSHALEFTCGFLIPLSVGATITYVHTLKSRPLFEVMQETGTTVILAMPRFFRLLYDSLQRQTANGNESTGTEIQHLLGGKLRFLISGGAALDPDLYEAFQRLGLPIYEGYGLTESAPVLTVNPPGKSKKGSVGLPFPGVEVRIENPNAHGIGEIVVRSPGIMNGYFHNPRATAKVLKDGWLYTGDLGYRDEEGYLYITGRTKDIIVSGAGKNIYPEELEALYKAVPGVAEICIVGLPLSETCGEEVHAVIVPTLAHQGDSEELQQQIRQEIKKLAISLPTYKHIQKIHFWTTLPKKSGTSEIHRQQVKDILRHQLAQGKLAAQPPMPIWTPQDWEEKVVIEELARLLNRPITHIHPDHYLVLDLGIDSLLKMELLLMLETRLGSSIPEHLFGELQTVQDVLDRVKKQQKRQRKLSRVDKEALSLLESLTLPQNPSPLCRLAKRLFKATLRTIYHHVFHLQCHGLEYLPRDIPYIIAANHCSHLDSGAIIAALGEEAKRLYILGARDYFFTNRWKGWFVNTFLHVLPFDRHENFLQGIRISQRVLAQGNCLLIYPEGGRSITGELQSFKKGLGFLACEARVPIIPAYIHGTYAALPKGALLPKKSKISVTFGMPILIDAYRERKKKTPNHFLYQEITDKVRNSIVELRDQSGQTEHS